MDLIESKHKAEQELRDNDIQFERSISAGLEWKPENNYFVEATINRRLKNCKLYIRDYNYKNQRVFKCSLGRYYKLLNKRDYD